MKNKNTVKSWVKFRRLNRYYHDYQTNLVKQLIPKDASVLEVGSKGGELLSALPNKKRTGIILSKGLFRYATKKRPECEFVHVDEFDKKLKNKKFDYVLISHAFTEIDDVQGFLNNLKKYLHYDSRIIVLYFNFLWKPLIDLGETLGLKRPQYLEPNWLSKTDLDNLFYLEDFDKVKSGSSLLFPYQLPFISNFLNKYISRLPILTSFSLLKYEVYRNQPSEGDYSVSIVIPARNEAGHMKGVLEKISRFAKEIEIIFVEGHSGDNTYEVIEKEINSYEGDISLSLFKQEGKGKGDAVRLGFAKATNEVLMILDADLTVDPDELPKFYTAIKKGKGDLVMGSRLVYPMEDRAMRTLNYFGNKFFSQVFTFLLGQPIKDTLCGTKVLHRDNYEKIRKNRDVFGDFDPFGDFDLIFGAARLNLKIVEIPIRYKERVYGETNISRYRHGLLLMRMVWFAANKLKFI